MRLYLGLALVGADDGNTGEFVRHLAGLALCARIWRSLCGILFQAEILLFVDKRGL